MSTRTVILAGATAGAVIALAHYRRRARCTPIDEAPGDLVKLCLSVARGSKRAILVLGKDTGALKKAQAPGSRAVYPTLTAPTHDGWAVLDLHDYSAALQARGLTGDVAGKGETVRSKLIAMSNRSLVELAVAMGMGRDDTFHFLRALAEEKSRRGDTAAAKQLQEVATGSRVGTPVAGTPLAGTGSRVGTPRQDGATSPRRSSGSGNGSPVMTRITRKSSSEDLERLVRAVAVPPKLEIIEAGAVSGSSRVSAPLVTSITRKSSAEDMQRLVKAKAVRSPNSRS